MAKNKIQLDVALENLYDEVDYIEFYRDIFPEGSLQEKGVFEEGKYNGIAVAISKNDNKTRRYTITDELGTIDDLVASDDFCLMSPISYIGKERKSANARYMYALAIDLDGVDDKPSFDFFITQIEEGHEMLSMVMGLPKPTYVVWSGTGLHIYYVFQNPIPLYKNVVEQLETLKKRLTWQAWTQGASSLSENVQYESLFQGFRMVGTITKLGDRARAFRTGEKCTISYLNKFIPEEYRADEKLDYKSKLSLAEAKEKYPDWYQRRIVEGKPKNTWTCKKDLYDWWLRTFPPKVQQGHRYWCIMTLATYAKKCGVSRDELEKDAFGLIPLLNERGKDPFTVDDVMHALEAYDDSYITYPIHTIVSRTDIPIQKNKRNGRSQEVHLERARAVQNIDYPNGEWRNIDGRPKGSGTKENIIKKWRENHPDGKKIECERDTGLSRHTVLKWWE